MDIVCILLMGGGLLLGIILLSLGASSHSVGTLVGALVELILTLSVGVVLMVASSNLGSPTVESPTQMDYTQFSGADYIGNTN